VGPTVGGGKIDGSGTGGGRGTVVDGDWVVAVVGPGTDVMVDSTTIGAGSRGAGSTLSNRPATKAATATTETIRIAFSRDIAVTVSTLSYAPMRRG
jgi:hypothetical protein